MPVGVRLSTACCVSESATHGFMHKIYRVKTDNGIYAVKYINSELMKRPDAPENHARAEKSYALDVLFGTR